MNLTYLGHAIEGNEDQDITLLLHKVATTTFCNWAHWVQHLAPKCMYNHRSIQIIHKFMIDFEHQENTLLL